MARGYDRLEYSLMNDIYDEQVYGYGTNSYANESYYNGTDYSDYESYNDGYKSGYKAAMEAFGKKKGFFAELWGKVVAFFQRIVNAITGLFKKKQTIPEKIWAAVTSEKGKQIATLGAALAGATAIIIRVHNGFAKYRSDTQKAADTNAEILEANKFTNYLKACTEDLKHSGDKIKSVLGDVKSAGSSAADGKTGVAGKIAFISAANKCGWGKAIHSLFEEMKKWNPFAKYSNYTNTAKNNPDAAAVDKMQPAEAEKARSEAAQELQNFGQVVNGIDMAGGADAANTDSPNLYERMHKTEAEVEKYMDETNYPRAAAPSSGAGGRSISTDANGNYRYTREGD